MSQEQVDRANVMAVIDEIISYQMGGRIKNTRARWGNTNPLVLPTGDRVVVRVLVKTAVKLLDISNQKRQRRYFYSKPVNNWTDSKKKEVKSSKKRVSKDSQRSDKMRRKPSTSNLTI